MHALKCGLPGQLPHWELLPVYKTAPIATTQLLSIHLLLPVHQFASILIKRHLSPPLVHVYSVIILIPFSLLPGCAYRTLFCGNHVNHQGQTKRPSEIAEGDASVPVIYVK